MATWKSAILILGVVGCVSDADTSEETPDPGAGEGSNDGASMPMPEEGDSAATDGDGAEGAGDSNDDPEPAPSADAIFRCEDPNAPKTIAMGETAIVDFDEGTFASGADYQFSGGAASGGTYTYQEEGTQVMQDASMVADRNGGQALGVSLTNATDYGGGVGVYFYPCVDASAFSGFSFWARGSLPERSVDGATVPAGTVSMSLDVGDVAVNSLDSIGCAMDTPADATACVRPSTTFVVSDEWTQFSFSWSDFDPGARNGTPVEPTGDNFLGINLAMDNAFGEPNDLELVIDEFAFTP